MKFNDKTAVCMLAVSLTWPNHAPKIRQCSLVLWYAPNKKSKELGHN
jgi:hypothetical protein